MVAPTTEVRPADLSKALRAEFWPHLKAVGFSVRTDRAAWRYVDGAVDVVDVWSVGPAADAVGCPSVSFSAMVSSLPAYLPAEVPTKNGQQRPHYWHCTLHVQLAKTLSQPWFTPFSQPPKASLTQSLIRHREGLMAVIRRDRHDRSDVWFVRDDGSNLAEVVADLWGVAERVGLPALDRMHDPCQTEALLRDRTVVVDPDSLSGYELLEQARLACQER